MTLLRIKISECFFFILSNAAELLQLNVTNKNLKDK